MTKRTPKETWDAIRRQAEQDEIDRFLAKTPAEVDASLRARGHDPAAVRAEGEAFVKKLRAEQAGSPRPAWQVEAAEGLAREQARFEARVPKYAGLSRAQLVERLSAARTSSRFAQPVAVMFRNRKPEEATEEELRAILEEIDALGEVNE
jgi:hypothetical protein